MRRFVSLNRKYLFPVLLILIASQGFSQGLNLITVTTPSICYNDGTIVAKARGGTAPYSYSIIGGPSHPGITYPIAPALGRDTFIDLPHGTFYIAVTDAVGDTGTFSSTIGGIYQFPSLSFDLVSLSHGIVANVSGGRAPYQYAISSVSSYSGFSPYQSSDTFRSLCPGTYWIRVIDSCSNIFTGIISMQPYGIGDNINCYNASKGTIDVSAYGGIGPYTYQFYHYSNNTGSFAYVPPYYTGLLTYTDSCGVSANNYIRPVSITMFESCRHDSNIYCNIPYLGMFDTLTFICTNCNPSQTFSITNGYPYNYGVDTIFRHLPSGNYHIVVLGSACGGDTMESSLVPEQLTLSVTTLNCHSISVEAVNEFGQIVPADSFALYLYGDSISIGSSPGPIGLFNNLVPTRYQRYTIVAYLTGGCDSIVSADWVFTNFQGGEAQELLMKDSNCQNTILLNISPFSFETWFLIDPTGDTIYGAEFYSPWRQELFYNLNPSITSYTLVSDSGCSMNFNPYLNLYYSTVVYSSVPCAGLPTINYKIVGDDNFNRYTMNLYYRDSLVYSSIFDPNNPAIEVSVTDTGLYKYKIFFYPWAASPDIAFDTASVMRYDTLCPIDTGGVYVSNSSIPYPYPDFGYVCHLRSISDSVVYNIYGGAIPYTVEFLGYDTAILNTNTGVFVAPHPGNYTMLVYDNCGISRSYTFSVIDTCPRCISRDTIYATITQGGSYYFDSMSLTLAGIYRDTSYGSDGCDSISILDLRVVQILHVAIETGICSGHSYSIGTHTYYTSGVYIDTLTSNNAYDTIVRLNLTVYPVYRDTSIYNICRGQRVYFHHTWISSAGYYSDTLLSRYGCDSILTMHLFVYPTPSVTLYDTICQGAYVIVGPHTYFLLGTSIDTLTGIHGCDSIVTLHLFVRSMSASSHYDTICQGSPLNGHIYTQSGTYADTLAGRYGCDSISTLHLTIFPIDSPAVYITVSPGPLAHREIRTDTFAAVVTDCANPSYDWYKNGVAMGAHTPAVTVTYATGTQESIMCIVTCNNECSTVSSLTSNQITTSVSDIISTIQSVNIYPNPTRNSFTIDISIPNISDRGAQILITDILGQAIFSKPIMLQSGDNQEAVSLGEDVSSGIYIVQITLDGQSIFRQLVLDR